MNVPPISDEDLQRVRLCFEGECSEESLEMRAVLARLDAALADTASIQERAARVCEALIDESPGDDKLRAAAAAIRDGAWDD